MKIDGIEYVNAALEPWQEVLNLRVDHGEAWLDENEPKWYLMVKPEVLDLSSGFACICGQVFNQMFQQAENNEYDSGWDYWFNKYDLDGEEYGFDSESGLCIFGHRYSEGRCSHNFVGDNVQYSYLTEEWLRRMEKKLANV